jgi:hypothetical protein
MRTRIISIIILILHVTFGKVVSQDKFKIKFDSLLAATDSVAIDTAIVGDTKEFAQVKQKEDKFFWDAHVRLRHEFWNNQEDLNDDLDDLYSFFRIKFYISGGIRTSKNTNFYGRLVNEARFYGHKGTGDTLNNDQLFSPERGYYELAWAQLYFKWKNIGNKPLTAIIGRQTLHDKGFGNQWLIGDGTPLDGSKTFYYNAVRLTYIPQKHHRFDFVALVNFKDDPLVIYTASVRPATNITDEQGSWLWYKNTVRKKLPFDLFYLYKHENGGGGYQREEVSNIHTAGFHVKSENALFWSNVQMVGQVGNYGNNSRSGFGTIAYAGVQYKSDKTSLKIGPWYMFLTGDDPSTPQMEGFNNLFGGYPNDDELYLNTWARESGTSMWTNINLIGAFAEYRPTAKYNIRFWYHYMLANKNVEGSFFGTGKKRGQMVMLKAMADISPKFKAYYMFEYLWAGDFYTPNADDAILSRINLEWYF